MVDELIEVKDEVIGLFFLKFLRGFCYMLFGWVGDFLWGGRLILLVYDGMVVVFEEEGVVILVRNYEFFVGCWIVLIDGLVFDNKVEGGCMNFMFDMGSGEFFEFWGFFLGILRNCVGGVMFWGIWLSCEEIVFGLGDVVCNWCVDFDEIYGWIFEVLVEGY